MSPPEQWESRGKGAVPMKGVFRRALLATLGRPGPPRAMALAATAAFLGTAMNVIVRHVADDLHPFEVAFFRVLFGFLALAPLLVRYGAAPFRTRRLRLLALRGVINAVGTLLFIAGLVLAPLAKVAALMFSSPLFTAVMALVVLRESIRLRRVMALIVGFAGTLVIVQPGLLEVDFGALLTLGSAAAIAVTMILAKVLVRSESALTITLYTALVAIPITFIAAVPVWQTPALEQIGWLTAAGVVGSLNHLCQAQALKEADVTAVLPVGFTRLIWASVFGYLVFAEIPDPWTWVGGTMIFFSASYIAYRERRIRQSP
jgi:drug/metabolite transporter (DMT)-like permease